MDAKAIRLALENDGYFVAKAVVSPDMCLAVLEAIRDDVGISVHDPGSWARVSSEVDQVPLWGHQSQWDIRQLPQVHSLFSAVWGTPRGGGGCRRLDPLLQPAASWHREELERPAPGGLLRAAVPGGNG